MKSLINRRAARAARNFHRHPELVLTTPNRPVLTSKKDNEEVMADDSTKQHNDVSAKG